MGHRGAIKSRVAKAVTEAQAKRPQSDTIARRSVAPLIEIPPSIRFAVGEASSRACVDHVQSQ
jgi:hypothetical protein